jgi:hypothetical protein
MPPLQKRLDALEEQMGVWAALLSDVANALSEHPNGLEISGTAFARQPETLGDAIKIDKSEWPSIDEIGEALLEWYQLRRELPARAANKASTRVGGRSDLEDGGNIWLVD